MPQHTEQPQDTKTLQHYTATHYNTATHCNATLQHLAATTQVANKKGALALP